MSEFLSCACGTRPASHWNELAFQCYRKHYLERTTLDKRGIFCVEGEWENNLSSQTSVQQFITYVGSNLTQLPKQDSTVEYLPPIYRRAATPQEFSYLVNKWSNRQYSGYTVGYFAFHGSAGKLWLGGEYLDLSHIATLLKEQCSGKHIIFSSCSTLSIEPRKLAAFLKETKARSVSGYTKDTDWYECSALDLILMTDLLYYDDPSEVKERLGMLCSGLISEYGFDLNCQRPPDRRRTINRKN